MPPLLSCPAGTYQFQVSPTIPAASFGSMNAPLPNVVFPVPTAIESPTDCAAPRVLEKDAAGSGIAPPFTPNRPLALKPNCGPTANRQPLLRSVTNSA